MSQEIRVCAAWCFTCLYLFLSIVAPLHSHAVGDADFGIAASCASHGAGEVDVAEGEESSAVVTDSAKSPLPTISAPGCPVCDFLAQPVTAESAPLALSVPIAQTAIPAPPVRAAAYKPFRFCDRSASRAPPAVSSLLA